MKNNISQDLINEQNEIINSNSKKIVVSAGPGSGKTYTIIKKVTKELEEIKSKELNKGIILCSFSKESSLELKKRLGSHKDDKTFIGTLDSFIFSQILKPFGNRILSKNKKSLIKNKKFEFVKTGFVKNDEVNILTRQGITDWNKLKIEEYFEKWIIKFQNGSYEISFPTYLLSRWGLMNVVSLKKFIKNRFNSIYIDEAQDLNEFQMKFIKTLIKETSLNCYLIGDSKQSIYGFRGAKPKLFLSFTDHNFDWYKITHSTRCHYNILEFSRRIVGESKNTNKLENDMVVNYMYDFDKNYDSLKEMNEYFILVEKNEDAEILHRKLLDNQINDVIYSKSIKLDDIDKSFSDNYYDIIEELLRFFFNHNNKIPKFTYSIEKLIDFLEPMIEKKNIDIKKLEWNNNFEKYFKKVFSLGNIEIPKKILDAINKQIRNEIYINHYLKSDNKKRIMTIHSSKGLESKNVFIYLIRKWYKMNDENKRKLFVAFTRAKNKIFISFSGNELSPTEEYINCIFKNTFK